MVLPLGESACRLPRGCDPSLGWRSLQYGSFSVVHSRNLSSDPSDHTSGEGQRETLGCSPWPGIVAIRPGPFGEAKAPRRSLTFNGRQRLVFG